jgi:hypothetical protein
LGGLSGEAIQYQAVVEYSYSETCNQAMLQNPHQNRVIVPDWNDPGYHCHGRDISTISTIKPPAQNP